MATLGRHIILEMRGCSKNVINDVEKVKNILTEATKVSRATLVEVICHHFSPYGVTGVAILAESHISVHTWPEHAYAAADIFICGNTDPRLAASYIADRFHAHEYSMMELQRGNFSQNEIQYGIPVIQPNTHTKGKQNVFS